MQPKMIKNELLMPYKVISHLHNCCAKYMEKLKEEFNVKMCDHVSEMELTCF